MEYQGRSCNLRADAGVAHYDFPRQRLSLSRADTRHRSDLVLGLRWEQKLVRAWRLQFEYNWEAALANDLMERYTANTIQGGMVVDF
jgi:hypothetical protein